jgi:hypothetical protein
VLAGAGVGLVLGPASTDAVNRVEATRYGEATGINQTIRNFGSSIGLAVLGTILIIQNKSNIEDSLGALGVPKEQADAVAGALSQSGGGEASSALGDATGPVAERAFQAVQDDFAHSTQTVFYVMTGIMIATYLVAHVWLPKDRVTAGQEAPDVSASPERP